MEKNRWAIWIPLLLSVLFLTVVFSISSYRAIKEKQIETQLDEICSFAEENEALLTEAGKDALEVLVGDEAEYRILYLNGDQEVSVYEADQIIDSPELLALFESGCKMVIVHNGYVGFHFGGEDDDSSDVYYGMCYYPFDGQGLYKLPPQIISSFDYDGDGKLRTENDFRGFYTIPIPRDNEDRELSLDIYQDCDLVCYFYRK